MILKISIGIELSSQSSLIPKILIEKFKETNHNFNCRNCNCNLLNFKIFKPNRNCNCMEKMDNYKSLIKAYDKI